MFTTRKLEHLDAPILRLVRGLCREAEYDARKRGRVTMTEMCDEVREQLGVELVSRGEAGPLKRLQNEGAIARFPVKEGRAEFQAPPCYTYRVTDLDALSMFAVLDLARRQVNPSLKLRPGRKSTSGCHASREVLEVKDTQLELIEQALKRLVVHLVPRCRPREGDTREQAEERFLAGLRTLHADVLIWEDGAGAHGLGDWAILSEMAEACRGLEQNTVDRYVGAVRTLLDLAATHGFLIRRHVHGGQRTFLPATWTEALAHWDRIVRESAHRHRGAGTVQLSRIMAGMGEHFSANIEDVDPCRLTREQSESFARGFKAVLDAENRLTPHQRSTILSTLRALMDGGVLHLVDITAYDRRRIRGRKNAFESGAMKAIAREFDANTRKAKADHGLFAALGSGAFFDPDNGYSLPRLVDWYTLTSVRHRERMGMSAVNTFPRAKVRGSGGLSGRLWGEATLLQHLELIGIYLGYLSRYHGVDLAGAVDARELFTKDFLVDFVDAVDEDDWTSEKRALDIVYHVSLYTSPCWESAALRAGAEAQADAFQALSDYAAGRGNLEASGYNGLTLHKSQRQEWGLARNGDYYEGQRRRAREVQEAYEKATGEQYAYVAMLKFRNAAIRRFCRELGVDSLDDLTGQISTGRTLSVTEFSTLRDLTIWSDGLAAPNRRKTVSLLDKADRHEKPNGELWARIPAEKMKVTSNGEYELLMGKRGVGGAMGYRFDLSDCYDAARHQFLVGAQTEVLYISTSPREREGRDRYRLAPGTVSGLYTNALRYGAEEPKVDISPILALDGLASSHAQRHAAASFFVAHNRHELARRMLHHKGLDVLLKVYARGAQAESAETVMNELGDG
jgi:hypothetical protein